MNPEQRFLGRLRKALLACAAVGLLALYWLFSIPADPKNSVLLGLSASRWALILIAVILTLGLLAALVSVSKIAAKLAPATLKSNRGKIVLAVLLGLLLWVSLLYPAQYLGDFKDQAERLRPLIVLALAIPLAVTLALINPDSPYSQDGETVKLKWHWVVLPAALLMLLYYWLQRTGAEFSSGSLIQPAGALITPLQLGLAIGGLILILVFTRRTPRGWVVALILAAATFVLWWAAPLPCSNDRLPAEAPNQICYPQIDDAVYSMGSAYTTLGQGIYNHWVTDKPFYMGFMALGQWIFGPEIDRYLIFQLLFMSFLPLLIYLLAKRFLGSRLALLPAVLMMLSNYNAIVHYNLLDGINVKFENTEMLTAWLLLTTCLLMLHWLQDGKIGALLLGNGVLGAAVLTRFNALAVVPVLVLVAFFAPKGAKLLQRLKFGAVMTAGLLIVVLPWMFNAVDAHGNNFYWMKIQDVIQSRYRSDMQPNSEFLLKPIAASRLESIGEKNVLISVGEQFANNAYTALTEFPVTFRLVNSVDTLYSPAFYEQREQPIWRRNLSPENLAAISLTLVLYTLGAVFLIQRWKWAGSLPLMVQGTYFLGNSLSQTSGGRYLTPVSWVTLLYVSAGIAFLILCLVRRWGIPVEGTKTGTSKGITNVPWLAALAAVIVLGAFLPLLNQMPSKFAMEDREVTAKTAFEQIKDHVPIPAAQWESLKNNPNVIVTTGYAYHPSFTRVNELYPGVQSLQVLVLGKDMAYETVLFDRNAPAYFSAGSRVILIGCKVGEKNYWGAPFAQVQTFALLQQDHEGYRLYAAEDKWNCGE